MVGQQQDTSNENERLLKWLSIGAIGFVSYQFLFSEASETAAIEDERQPELSNVEARQEAWREAEYNYDGLLGTDGEQPYTQAELELARAYRTLHGRQLELMGIGVGDPVDGEDSLPGD